MNTTKKLYKRICELLSRLFNKTEGLPNALTGYKKPECLFLMERTRTKGETTGFVGEGA
jgi:hypothetical protein